MRTLLSDKLPLYQEATKAMNPVETMAYLARRHPGKTVFSTSMGAEDQVLLHLIATTGLKIHTFTLDTGRLFQETYDLIQITREKYNHAIEICFPDAGRVEKMVNEKGINLFYDSVENRKLCCHVRKIEPSRKKLKEMELWITGIRRSQVVTRRNFQKIEWIEDLNILKVNPLIDWSEADVWNFIRTHKIPYNTLHDKGFPSIGCLPCTRAVAPGEPLRAGRWYWEDPTLKECGLHTRK